MRRPLDPAFAEDVQAQVKKEFDDMCATTKSRARYVHRNDNEVPVPQHVDEGASFRPDRNMILVNAVQISNHREHGGEWEVTGADRRARRILTTRTMIPTLYSEFSRFSGKNFKDFLAEFAEKFTGYRKEDVKPLTDFIIKYDNHFRFPETILSVGAEDAEEIGYRAVYEQGRLLKPGQNGNTAASINRKAAERDKVRAERETKLEALENSYDSDELYGEEFMASGADDVKRMKSLRASGDDIIQDHTIGNPKVFLDSNGRIQVKEAQRPAASSTHTGNTRRAAKVSGTSVNAVDLDVNNEKDAERSTNSPNISMAFLKAALASRSVDEIADLILSSPSTQTIEMVTRILEKISPGASKWAHREVAANVVKQASLSSAPVKQKSRKHAASDAVKGNDSKRA